MPKEPIKLGDKVTTDYPNKNREEIREVVEVKKMSWGSLISSIDDKGKVLCCSDYWYKRAR